MNKTFEQMWYDVINESASISSLNAMQHSFAKHLFYLGAVTACMEIDRVMRGPNPEEFPRYFESLRIEAADTDWLNQ